MSVSEICVHSNFIWLEIVSNMFRYRDAERERHDVVWMYATMFSICVIVLEWCQENGNRSNYTCTVWLTPILCYGPMGVVHHLNCVKGMMICHTILVHYDWLWDFVMTAGCCYIWQEYQIAALVFALHVGSVHVELRLCINLSNEHNYSVIGVIREVPVHLIFY